MRRNLFSALAGFLLMCGVMLLTSCSGSSSSGNLQTVTIGVLAPMSGSLKTIGEGMQAALEVALPQVNRRLELEGKNFRIKTLVRDTASDPQTALTALATLKAAGVTIVIGPISSAECEAVLSYANSHEMILLSPGSTASSLAIAGDNLYRLIPDDSCQGAATAALMLKKRFRAVVPIWRDDVWGNGLKKNIADAFQSGGGAVMTGVSFTPGATDYTTALDTAASQVSQALTTYGRGNVAVVMLSFPAESAALLSGAASRPDLAKAGWFGSDALTLSPVLTASATASAFAAQTNLLSPIFSREDAILPVKGIVLNDRVLRERISLKLGRNAETTAFGAWDALWLATRAYADSTATDLTSLRSALVTAAFNNVGLSGSLVFNDAGDMKKSNYAFYGIASGDGSPTWKLKAAYQYELLATPQVVDVTEPTPKGLNPPTAKVKIGALLSLTGGQAYAGKSVRAGLKAALADVNNYFKWHGYPVQFSLEIINTDTDPAKALKGFNTLADRGVRFIVGPLSSAECQNVLAAANSRGVVLVTPSGNAIQLAIADDNLIRFVPSATNEAAALATLLQHEGITSLAILARNDIWGADLAQQTATDFQDLGGKVLGTFTYPANASSYTDQLTALSNAVSGSTAATTAVLALSFDEITDIFLKAEAHQSLANVKWFGGDGTAQNERIATNSSAAAFAAGRGFTCPIEHVFISHSPQKNSIPKLAIRDEIRESYGGTPALYAFPAWDSLWIIATTLMDTEWSADPAVLRNAVISGSDSYIGMSNFMGLDANGDRKYGDYAFFTLTRGTKEYTWDHTATYHFHPALYLPPRMTYP